MANVDADPCGAKTTASPQRQSAADGALRGARVSPMRSPPIPQRIPPLKWRNPAFIWTPLALAAAIGAPAALFYDEPLLQRFVLVAGAAVFALALITLGAGWALGHAPRTRRTVVLHVLSAGALSAFAAPLAFVELLALIAGEARGGFDVMMSMAMTPLALVLGLPVALISGIVFAFLALKREPAPRAGLDDSDARPHDVQPFR